MQAFSRSFVLLNTLLLTSAFGFAQSASEAPDSVDKAPERAVRTPESRGRDSAHPSALQALRSGPLRFERNAGQFDSQVKFTSRGLAHSLFLTPSEAVLVLTRPEASAKVPGWREYRRSRTAMATTRTVARFKLAGANRKAEIEGETQLPGRSNYLIGRDQNRWRTGVENFARVRYRDVYPGIDWVYYGNHGQLEYDFVVSPGSDPSQIALEIGLDGSNSKDVFRISPEGNLILAADPEGIQLHRPVAYQMADGHRQLVSASYAIQAPGRVSFELGPYDTSLPLVIDPVLSFSTYLGGTLGNANAFGVAVDSTGIYVAGVTNAGDFPTTSGTQQENPGASNCSSTASPNPCADAFVTKLSPDGTSLIYSTYLGGSAQDSAFSIAVDGNGNAVVTGGTNSSNFPVTAASAFQQSIATSACQASDSSSINCEDAFVSVLNDVGSLLIYSSYLGGAGNDFASGVAVDLTGNVFITGFTDSDQASFPETAGVPGGGTCSDGTNTFPCGDAFVARFDPALSGPNSRIYVMFLGGNGDDFGNAIAVDTNGDAFVAGITVDNTSGGNSFPVTGGFQATFNGFVDGFIAKINHLGPAVSYSSFLGGNDDDQAIGIALDSSGKAVLAGYTHSANFWSKNALPGQGARDPSNCNDGCYDAFVMKVDTAQVSLSSLVYSTYLGGSDDDRALAVTVDASDNVYVAGATGTPQTGVAKPFPLLKPLQSTKAGDLAQYDAFVSQINSAGSDLLFSTYFGGGGDFDVATAIKASPSGEVIVAGRTNSISLPITLDSAMPLPQGIVDDAFVARIDPGNLPAAGFSTALLDFGAVGVGSTSPVASVVLLNMGRAQLDISGVAITGPNAADFAPSASTTCGSSLAAGSLCYFDLTFAPSLALVHNAFLTVTDNASGSPHNVPLTGSGTADFTMTAADNSETVAPGATASFTLTLTPLGGFNSTIAFSCSGFPVNSTCNPPSSTSLDGANPRDVSLSVVTQSRTAAPPNFSPFAAPPLTAPQSYLPWLAAWLMLAATILRMAGRKRRTVLVLTATLLTALAWSACGGGGGGGATPKGTPAGTYTITATATSGSITKTTTLTMIVQ